MWVSKKNLFIYYSFCVKYENVNLIESKKQTYIVIISSL
jgi:hypothetical protein